jgi:hypothetical protein
MPNQHRNTTHGWAGGWRPRRRRRLRRIEPSPDFTQFLVGELDSREYARLLMRPRKTAGVEIKAKPQGPIARARQEAIARNVQVGAPSAASGTVRVLPEYLLFLREEISSSAYAEAVTDCARLEGLYRAPAVGLSSPRRGPMEALQDTLRLFFVVVGLAMAILGLLPLLAPLGAALAASLMHWAWSMSSVGVILLAVTVFNPASSLVHSGAHFLQRSVIERFAHQRI